MDRNTWMYGIPRNSPEFTTRVEEFINCAEKHQELTGRPKILCPCRDCQNITRQDNVIIIRNHLVERGWMDKYTRWIWHGEDSEKDLNTGTSINESDLENIVQNDWGTDVGDDASVDENTENRENVGPECDDDNLDEMMNELPPDFIDDVPEIFQKLDESSHVPLYPGCDPEKFSKIKTIFKLFNLKAKYNWSDISFTSLLKLLREILPAENTLPDTTYKAKKLLCPLNLEVEKIPACPNDCILFRNEYKNLHKCPECNASRYKQTDDDLDEEDGKKRPSAKTLWYLPIIPRFQRLFNNSRDAKLLRWHAEGRKKDGKIRHPADSTQWRTIDRTFEDFGSEPRNLRLGLCTDGMNPYGLMSNNRSIWPVLVVIYNLPSWLCMKRRYMMMPLLIPDPKQPGNDIDVYLAPLIEDLHKLWKDGVKIFDSHSKSYFTLRAMVFCTINDFPAYGNLSGYRNKGKMACPICEEETHSIWLSNCRKNVYLGHRRFLNRHHPYRRSNYKTNFDGKTETRPTPVPKSGWEIYNEVKDINVRFGKTFAKDIPEGKWKKKSIFWDLEYWPYLEVRHCLDAMHIIKNICEILINLILNAQGKVDNVNVRKDMVEMGIRLELAAKEDTGKKRDWLPAAAYTLSNLEKSSLLECLKSIRVPTGYSSNISRKVSIKDKKLIGMKSHDYHVLLTQLLPVAIRACFKEKVRNSITKLCFFFNEICCKVIDPETLTKLETDTIQTVCELEMHFPPSFFVIMVHLTIHLVREIRLCGPVFLRYMYPFERAMGQLKGLVRSRSRPEGSIVEGYIAEEVIDFYTDYVDGSKPVGLPKNRHDGRLLGKGTLGRKLIKVDLEKREKAHLKILQQVTVVAPYVNEHIAELQQQNPERSEKWITDEHNKMFVQWFRNRVRISEPSDEIVKCLAHGPNATVHTYQGYDLNGFTWYTKKQDGKSTVQNSGVTIVAISEDGKTSESYYGWIEEIWELDYIDFRIPVFECKWIDKKGVRRNKKQGFVSVDLKKLGYHDDLFILANKQAMQVFYIVDPADKTRHIVLPGKRRIIGVEDVTDEEEYDQFDEIPPFSAGIDGTPLPVEELASHLRSDQQEGVWVGRPKSKEGT